MFTICPTITADDAHDYLNQMERLKPFAHRVHIDLMDGILAPSHSPEPKQVWWFDSMQADIHLMYKRPEPYLESLIEIHPSLVIIHYEAELDYQRFATNLKQNGIKAGLAILQDTSVETVAPILPDFDHVLVFSGRLGYVGGKADLGFTSKVKELNDLGLGLEIGWDGGINDSNALDLANAGVSVLNVGGFIRRASDPAAAYAKLKALAA